MKSFSTTEITKRLGVTNLAINRWIASGFIRRPENYRRGGKRLVGTSEGCYCWTAHDARLLAVIGTLVSLCPKRGRHRRLVLGIDWDRLAALLHDNPDAGWLVVNTDGQMAFTTFAEQAAEWQCTSRLAVCVAVAAL